MLPLIAPMLLIGFSSPSNSVRVSENKEPRERFITLRDYDFVGEDATLVAQLARRMHVLQAPLNLSELKPRADPSVPDAWQQWKHNPIQFKPDYLDSNLKLPQMNVEELKLTLFEEWGSLLQKIGGFITSGAWVDHTSPPKSAWRVNVSLDYAEIYNASDLTPDTNASSPALDSNPGAAAALGPGPGASLVPSPGATLIPGPYAAVALDLDRALGPNPDEGPNSNLDEGPGPKPDGGPGPDLSPGATPAPNASARRHPENDRRIVVNRAYDPNNFKVLDLMKHNIYSTQRKILELDNIIKKFQIDPRFRMAYIYNRLDEWLHNLRTLYYAMYRWRYYHLRVKRLIWYYEHSLRLNIDITYSIEHLMHLHTEYMKKMEFIVPLSTRQAIEEKKKQQRKLAKMKQMGFPEGTIV